MKWAVVNEIGNEEKRIERTIVEADTPTEAMLSEFTVGIYEAILMDDGTYKQGTYNHLIAINDKSNLARNMQDLLDAEKEKNEKYLLFDGSNFIQPNEEFQKEWGIQKLDLELTEDGQIKTQGVSRYASARCVHWETGENKGDE